jgi:hypothetical protein
MAGSMSDFLEKKVQNHLLIQNAFTPSAVMYIALFTDSNTTTQRDAGTITEAWPGNWTNYARIAVSASGVFFSASGTTAYVSNTSAFSWPAVNAAGPTIVSAFGMYDANSAGNLYFWADLTVPKSIASGDTPSFAIGGLGFTLD